MDINNLEEKNKKKRKEINDSIIRRLKTGDALQDPSRLTWFPPRPIIEKDKEAVRSIYGKDAKIVGPNKPDKVSLVVEPNTPHHMVSKISSISDDSE